MAEPAGTERHTAVEPAHSVRRVLLVEDDPGDAFLVRELLAEADPSLQVTVAGSVVEVLERELLSACDCVLLDLNVPGSNGLEGLRAMLHADDRAAVCVLTGLDDEHLGIAAVAQGAQDYLVKGKADGQVLIRGLRYAVELRRAEASLVRARAAERATAEARRLERGLLPKPLPAGSTVAATSYYRSGRAGQRAARAQAVHQLHATPTSPSRWTSRTSSRRSSRSTTREYRRLRHD